MKPSTHYVLTESTIFNFPVRDVPSPDFSPRLRDKIWNWPGDEATQPSEQARTMSEESLMAWCMEDFLPWMHMTANLSTAIDSLHLNEPMKELYGTSRFRHQHARTPTPPLQP